VSSHGSSSRYWVGFLPVLLGRFLEQIELADHKPTVDFNAHAELFNRTRSVDPPPHFAKPYTLGTLVKFVMSKRPQDQQIYSIMVRDTIYNAADIQALSQRLDFPKG
jgi:hypothetical protein